MAASGHCPRLIGEALSWARANGVAAVEVGTGNSSIGPLVLYQRVGFRIIGVDRDFFVRHYPSPIYENGLWCRDLVRLEVRWIQPESR